MEELLVLGLIIWFVIALVRRRRRRNSRLATPASRVQHVVRHVHTASPPVSRPRWEADSDPQKAKRPSLEHGILKTAKAHNGIVTPADVSIGTECGLDQAKLFLDRLVEGGHAELRATRNGDLVYVFPSLLGRNLPDDLEPLT